MEKISQLVYCNWAIKTLCSPGISFAEGLNQFKGLDTANAWIFLYLIHCHSSLFSMIHYDFVYQGPLLLPYQSMNCMKCSQVPNYKYVFLKLSAGENSLI